MENLISFYLEKISASGVSLAFHGSWEQGAELRYLSPNGVSINYGFFTDPLSAAVFLQGFYQAINAKVLKYSQNF